MNGEGRILNDKKRMHSTIVSKEELRELRLKAITRASETEKNVSDACADVKPIKLDGILASGTSMFDDSIKSLQVENVVNLLDDDSDSTKKLAANKETVPVISLLDDSSEDEISTPSKKNSGFSQDQIECSTPKKPSGLHIFSGENSFQVATWNVWFGPQGDGKPHPEARMRALSNELLEAGDDANLLFIGFQEVTDELAPLLESELRCRYHFFKQPPPTPYYCALAVHKSLRILEQGWRPFHNSQMDRGFLHVRANLPDSQHQFFFCTTHLESFGGPNYNGVAQRPIQLEEMELFCNERLAQYANVAIITGDLNWDDEPVGKSKRACLDTKLSSVLKNKEWKDTWLETHPVTSNKPVEGYTYDAKLNPMLGGSLRRRFDRCLVRANQSIETESTIFLGTKAIPGLKWQKLNSFNQTYKESETAPSDHFGYLVHLRMNPN